MMMQTIKRMKAAQRVNMIAGAINGAQGKTGMNPIRPPKRIAVSPMTRRRGVYKEE